MIPMTEWYLWLNDDTNDWMISMTKWWYLQLNNDIYD
jgi:hypothetical protein